MSCRWLAAQLQKNDVSRNLGPEVDGSEFGSNGQPFSAAPTRFGDRESLCGKERGRTHLVQVYAVHPGPE